MKIAIVTGASSGLGREFVKLLDRQKGVEEIWVVARRAVRLEALAKQVKTPVRPLVYDLTEKASIRAIRELLAREKPQVQMLINAAGYGKIGSYRNVSLEDCEGMIDLNCRAAVAMTQITLPYMKADAHIMEICSTAAFQPFPYLSVYAASKAFLYRYSRALRVELRERHISVTAVCPYWVKDTEFISTAQKSTDGAVIHSYLLASRQTTVARKAMCDTCLGVPVSTPGPVSSIHRVLAKIIPSELMMLGWELLRRI